MADRRKPRVAIGCQGGGSHAAFTAGVLRRLLEPDLLARFELLALSGTSGGAVCAALAWSGLIAGGAGEAARRLLGFWRDVAADDPLDAAMNAWGLWLAHLPVTAEVSPYLYEPAAEPALRALLGRHLRLEELPRDPARRARPALLVAAADILEGGGRIFSGEDLAYDDIIASAAIPPLFRAVATRGSLFWDGLFSHNPPVRAFTDLPERPDEIWIVRINPRRRDAAPRSMPQIIDRRNELSGNLSLDRELDFIEKINALREKYPALQADYKEIALREVELDLDLDYPSKFDRSPALIERLLAHGAAAAPRLLAPASLRPRRA